MFSLFVISILHVLHFAQVNVQATCSFLGYRLQFQSYRHFHHYKDCKDHHWTSPQCLLSLRFLFCMYCILPK
ncbi:hypothetical protein C0J52_23529 [Blattella germanica]|nr:hypothetical protein C0J52_23529 [Blattella germanica]